MVSQNFLDLGQVDIGSLHFFDNFAVTFFRRILHFLFRHLLHVAFLRFLDQLICLINEIRAGLRQFLEKRAGPLLPFQRVGSFGFARLRQFLEKRAGPLLPFQRVGSYAPNLQVLRRRTHGRGCGLSFARTLTHKLTARRPFPRPTLGQTGRGLLTLILVPLLHSGIHHPITANI